MKNYLLFLLGLPMEVKVVTAGSTEVANFQAKKGFLYLRS